MVAADAPLLPGNPNRGGALVTRDASGQESRLSLRKLHVDVHIEDGFARTTIDQTYFDHQSGRLEGTFYFPLPPDASLSRLYRHGINVNTLRYPEVLARLTDNAGDAVTDSIWLDLDYPLITNFGNESTTWYVPLFAFTVLDAEELTKLRRENSVEMELRELKRLTEQLEELNVSARFKVTDGRAKLSRLQLARRLNRNQEAASRADKFLEVLRQIELTGLSLQEEPPILFTTPEMWQTLTERRAIWKSVDTEVDPNSPKRMREAKILRELDQPTKMEFVEVPLRDAVAMLAEQPDIPIRLDEAKLADEGVQVNQPITLSVNGTTLRRGLKLLLQPLHLTYLVEDEVLKITSAVAATEKWSSRVLPLLKSTVIESAAEALLQRIASGQPRPARTVAIPRWNDLAPVSENLLLHAPDLHTSRADVLAVLEAEVADLPKPERGQVDPAARELIERCRERGWETVGWDQLAQRAPAHRDREQSVGRRLRWSHPTIYYGKSRRS